MYISLDYFTHDRQSLITQAVYDLCYQDGHVVATQLGRKWERPPAQKRNSFFIVFKLNCIHKDVDLTRIDRLTPDLCVSSFINSLHIRLRPTAYVSIEYAIFPPSENPNCVLIKRSQMDEKHSIQSCFHLHVVCQRSVQFDYYNHLVQGT